MLRGIAPDQHERYPSVPALQSDVEAFLEGQIVGAARYRIWHRVARLLRRHRAIVLVLALALTAAVGWSLWQRHQRQQEARSGAHVTLDRARTLAAKAESIDLSRSVTGGSRRKSMTAALAGFIQLERARAILGDDPAVAAVERRLQRLIVAIGLSYATVDGAKTGSSTSISTDM